MSQSGSEDKLISGFLVFSQDMISNLTFTEVKDDEYTTKLDVTMTVKVPYGVDVSRVAEDLTTLLGEIGCEGGVVLNDSKDSGEASI
jgi:hypothetical protein